MQLKDFISNALIDICEGIQHAQSHIRSGAIAPHTINLTNNNQLLRTENVHKVEQINFEVCVTIDTSSSSNTQNANKFGFLKVISAEIGKSTGKDSKLNRVNVNKITFSIPYLPQAITVAE